VTTPTSGRCVIHRLKLPGYNPQIIFEVSMITGYEDMKGNEKCRYWGGLGCWVWVTQGHRQCHHLIELYDLFDFDGNYASILYCFRVIVSQLSKITDFNLLHLHLSPPFEMMPFEFCQDLRRQKTRLSSVFYTTRRRYASVVYAIVVCLSHASIVKTDKCSIMQTTPHNSPVTFFL